MKILLLITIALASFAHAAVTKGDNLQIAIKGVPQEEQVQINGNYQVSAGGKIHLPYLTNQPISASGLSTTALSRRIEAAYRNAQIYTTPTISIISLTDQRVEDQRITENIQKFVTISGQVGRPGPQPYRKGLKLIDVVSSAGPTTFAAQNRIELLRNGKIYIYNMKVPEHMVELVYPNDQITVNEKKWNGR